MQQGRLEIATMESCKVMIVDDQAIERQILCAHLSHHFSITQYSSGHSAIQSFKQQSPDVILLDVKMPEIDGLKVCQRIRQVNSQVTVIFVSSVECRQTEKQCWEVGGDDFLSKPVTKSNLIDRIKTQMVMKNRVKSLEDQTYFHFPKYSIINKWYLDFLNRQCDISTMRKSPLSLSIIRFRNIDKLNDLLGWQATDDAITRVIYLVTKYLMNSNDLLVRYKREKLLCILPASGSESARHFVFMLQRIVSQSKNLDETTDCSPTELDCVTITQTQGKKSADEMINQMEQALRSETEMNQNRIISKTIDAQEKRYIISSYVDQQVY